MLQADLFNIIQSQKCYLFYAFAIVQLGSHRGAPLDSKNIAKNREKEEKIRKNREKMNEKIGKKRQKSGRFFHFASPDR